MPLIASKLPHKIRSNLSEVVARGMVACAAVKTTEQFAVMDNSAQRAGAIKNIL